jgi:hypothetical protein
MTPASVTTRLSVYDGRQYSLRAALAWVRAWRQHREIAP